MFLILCMLPTAAKQAGHVRYTGTCKVRALSRKDSSTANQMGCSNMLQFDIVRCKHRNHMATFLEIINFLAIIHFNTLCYNTSSVSSGPAPHLYTIVHQLALFEQPAGKKLAWVDA